MAILAAAVAPMLAAGCGGATGERRERLTPTVGLPDAAPDGTYGPPFVCSPSISALDCAHPAPLGADGHITDFSNREWASATGKWCDESGMHGSIFGYTNSSSFPNDTHMQTVPDGKFHIALSVTAGQYGGGGLAFEGGCLDVSAFTGFQFTVAVVSGSLANCPLQVQLQTFDERPIVQNPPNPPGGCDQNTTSCYSFPAATGLPTDISNDLANPTLIQLPFSQFSKISTALTQIVGLQWQVNATGGPCTVEFALDDIGFIPSSAPPEPGSSDGGATD